MNTFSYSDTALGQMLLTASDAALTGVYFVRQKYCTAIDSSWQKDADAPVIRSAVKQLTEYFAGRRTRFDLPLDPAGTVFQRQLWRAIAEVPYGKTITYAELARRVSKPHAVRAAGAATGRNPISVIVPCHRIVGSDGGLTGYAGGLERKTALLRLEEALKQPMLV